MRKIIPAFYIVLVCIACKVSGQSYIISTVIPSSSQPIGLTCDSAGDLFYAGYFNYTVQELTKGGVVKTVAGNGSSVSSGDGGPATSAGIDGPIGFAVDDSGNLYIAEFWGNRVRMVDQQGIIHTVAGNGTLGYTGDGGAATNAEINSPSAVVFDASHNMYIADSRNNVIRKVDPNGIISTYAGTGVAGYNGDGGAATNAALNYTLGVAIDGYNNIYIGDANNNVIRKVDANGIITTCAGTGNGGFSGDGGPATAARIDWCDALTSDVFGDLFIADDANDRIRMVNTKGIITTISGSGGVGYSGDGGLATLATMSDPDQIGVDDSGYIYFTDSYNNAIRKLKPTCYKAITLSPSIASVCGGQSVTLTVSGAKSYQWSPATGLNTITGDTVTASPTVTTTYSVTATDSPYCFSTKEIIIRVGITSVPIVVSPQSPSLCSGQGVSLTLPSWGSNYSWSPAAGLNATTGDSVVAAPTITTTYSVTGVDSVGCTVRDTDVVNIIAAPPLNIYPPAASICSGQGITLIADTTGANYLWNPAAGLSAVTGDSVLADPTATITYTVTGTDSVGCNVTGTETVLVQIGPNKPVIRVSVTGDTLFSSALNGNQWYINDTLITGATDSLFVIKGLLHDTIKVVVTNVANGCGTTSDEFTTGVNQLTGYSGHLTIYPNPTSGAITITSIKNIDEIIVTNLLGQLVYQKFHLLSNRLNFELKEDGMYFVTVKMGVETKTEKLIVSE